MKKVILFVYTVFTLSSCAIVSAPVNGAIYQKTQSAVSATANTLGSKKGEATATSILGLVAYGDASIQKAAKEAGITKISAGSSLVHARKRPFGPLTRRYAPTAANALS